MAPHSSTLAWKIPWMEEPGRLQSMGSLRVGHDWATSLSLFLSCTGEGNGNPLQCPCPENPRNGGAWWAAVYGVAQSQTRLKRLSSSSCKHLYERTFWLTWSASAGPPAKSICGFYKQLLHCLPKWLHHSALPSAMECEFLLLHIFSKIWCCQHSRFWPFLFWRGEGGCAMQTVGEWPL